MNKRTTVILIAGTSLFILSTAVLMATGGCLHRTDWVLPWMTISTSVKHPIFSVTDFAPLLLAAHLVVCFGVAWLLGLLVPNRRKQPGANRLA
jgi:hypothetical protein